MKARYEPFELQLLLEYNDAYNSSNLSFYTIAENLIPILQ